MDGSESPGAGPVPGPSTAPSPPSATPPPPAAPPQPPPGRGEAVEDAAVEGSQLFLLGLGILAIWMLIMLLCARKELFRRIVKQ